MRARPQQSGWRGSAGPYPQEGKPGPKAGHGRALAQPGPGQTGSKADRWSGGRAVCPPVQPTLRSGGRHPGLGGETLLGPCQVFRRQREGSCPSWKPTGAEAREGAEAGWLRPGRDPGGGREPGSPGAQMGAPWRQSEEKPQCKAISAGGPCSRAPTPRTARQELSGAHAHSPGGPGPRSIRRRQARLARGRRCLCTGVSWAVMLSDLLVPSGMGFTSLPPHTLRAREAGPRATCGGPPGGARRPGAGKDDGADSGLSTKGLPAPSQRSPRPRLIPLGKPPASLRQARPPHSSERSLKKRSTAPSK